MSELVPENLGHCLVASLVRAWLMRPPESPCEQPGVVMTKKVPSLIYHNVWHSHHGSVLVMQLWSPLLSWLSGCGGDVWRFCWSGFSWSGVLCAAFRAGERSRARHLQLGQKLCWPHEGFNPS